MRNVKQDVIKVVTSCETAFLSTINSDGFPETRALNNCLNRKLGDDLNMYLCSNLESRKIEQIKKNNKTSLYFNTNEMQTMSLCGNIEEVTDKALKDKFWRDQFAPYYQNGKDDPLYGILKFIPLSYKYYDYSSGIPQEVKGKF